MLLVKLYLFLFLGSTTVVSKVNQDHEIIAQYLVEVNNTENVYIKDVTLQDSAHWSIYNTYKWLQTGITKERAIHIFYTTISCKFADWIIHKIYDFVKSSPAFYQQESQSHDHIYETIFHPLFEKSLDTLIIDINKYIGRLINVLNNFLIRKPYDSYYNDTTVLKSLMALQIKLQFLSENVDGKYKLISRKSDSAIIRLILEEMNALQGFSSMNCKDLPASHRNSTFYGYWIGIDNVIANVSNINHFLFKLRNTFLESDPFKCFVSQIFLENIATLSSKNHISLDIAHAMVKITDTEYMPIKDILGQLKKSKDIDLVYLYLDSVLITIVKLIYTKIFDVYKLHLRYTSPIINNIMKINEKISDNCMNLPKYLVDGFELLMDIEIMKQKDYERLFKFYNESLNGIELGKWEKSLLHQSRFDSRRIIKNNVDQTESEENSMLDELTYLNNLTTRILQNFDDLKCFNQIFNFFRNENSRYYVPFIDNKKSHFPIEEENHKLDAICNFIENTYSLCYQVITLINKGTDNKISSTSNGVIFERARLTIGIIKQYFLALMEQNKNNIGFLKMAYNIVIMLINLKKTEIEFKNDYKLKRILNVIMTELDKYGIKNCTSPKLNLLFFNNINFIDFGNTNVVKDSMSNFFDFDPTHFDAVTLFFNGIRSTEDYLYLYIEYLYETFISSSEVFKLYELHITVLWKGRYEFISTIYDDLMNLTINSLYLYAFYDIYFTFYVVVVYSEIRYIIKKNSFEPIKKCFEIMSNNLVDFNYIYFPSKLHDLISAIKTLLNLPIAMHDKSRNQIMTQISTTGEEIEDQIGKFNFFFSEATGTTSKKSRIGLFSKEVIQTINLELNSNVKQFNDYFLKFKR